ncbi:hypothetical protein [Streptomyces laculatispora]|uniref:hypothetical protein n=1 Tax=Streptomyces laculatispora TaxID=887464 RepID=UPI001A94095C|nr:hypothetical protein [Streptomyces laculatispora]MBO0913966.1 hypothetical protein [Streptomyces laculatispora]
MKPRRESHGWSALQPPPGYYSADGRPPDAMQRALILDWAVSQRIASGWRVESRSATQVVMVRGRPLNHVLHAVLTVFSCFMWGVVWLVLGVTNKVERIALTADAMGDIVSVNGPGRNTF